MSDQQGSRGWWCAGVASVLAALLTMTMVFATGTARADAAPASTTVSITFDDGLAEQHAAADVLHKYGLKGTFYINSGAVGTPGYFTRDDLKRLVSLGHEIGGHSTSHLDLTTLPVDEARRQVCTDRATLTDWGFSVTSFAYPYAVYDKPVETLVQDCGYNSARASGRIHRPGMSPASCPGCPAAETIPPADPYAIRTLGEIDPTWTLTDLQNVVTTAEQHGGGWVVLILHHECDVSCTRLSISPAVLDTFAAWLKPREAIGTQVKTVGAVIGGSMKLAVDGPVAAEHDVVNPSLETSNDNGIPDCWMRSGWGTNSAQWDQTSTAHTGTKAQHVTVTGYTDGDAKLLPRLDLGDCTQPIEPGSRAVLQTWYQSSSRTQFALYYRTSWGQWNYWTSSSWFPPSKDWALASWTTPPAPDDAAGLAFGLALESVGSLTTDDYRMTPAPAASGASAIPLPPGGLPVVALLVAIAGLLACWVWRAPRPVTRPPAATIPQPREPESAHPKPRDGEPAAPAPVPPAATADDEHPTG